MSVTDEHRFSPSKILTKTKKTDGKDKEPDNDKDDKKSGKSKGNAMLDFIARNKKAGKED